MWKKLRGKNNSTSRNKPKKRNIVLKSTVAINITTVIMIVLKNMRTVHMVVKLLNNTKQTKKSSLMLTYILLLYRELENAFKFSYLGLS